MEDIGGNLLGAQFPKLNMKTPQKIDDLEAYTCPTDNTLNCVAGGGPEGSEEYDLCQNQDYQNWMLENCPNAKILE